MLLGALAMLVLVELGLRVLPVSTSTQTDYYISPNILTNPPNHTWTSSTGWDLRDVQRLHSNNLGFAAEHDFIAGADAIGLVGDSYVESSMLTAAERPAAQLERALGGQRLVYAMGGPGSSLLDYAERIQWAYRMLGLRTFVVMMEHVDATQALCGSGNVHAHCLLPDALAPVIQRRPVSGPLKALLRESALAQYLNSQLKFSIARLASPDFWRSGGPAKSHADVTGSQTIASPMALDLRAKDVIDAATDEFSRQIGGLDGLRLVFVIDMNRRNLEVGLRQPDEGYYFAQRLRSKAFTVVQGEPLYREHLRHSLLRLNVGPHDQHLNGMGVGLLMRAAAQALQHDSTNDKRN